VLLRQTLAHPRLPVRPVTADHPTRVALPAPGDGTGCVGFEDSDPLWKAMYLRQVTDAERNQGLASSPTDGLYSADPIVLVAGGPVGPCGASGRDEGGFGQRAG
jgi:hypothetical protein